MQTEYGAKGAEKKEKSGRKNEASECAGIHGWWVKLSEIAGTGITYDETNVCIQIKIRKNSAM